MIQSGHIKSFALQPTQNDIGNEGDTNQIFMLRIN
jgi:hypothetical protein